MMKSIHRPSGLALAFAGLLFIAPLTAQQQVTPPSDPANARRPIDAPVGHRQPRAADIPPSNKTEAELLEERQQAELNRKLQICRGC